MQDVAADHQEEGNDDRVDHVGILRCVVNKRCSAHLVDQMEHGVPGEKWQRIVGDDIGIGEFPGGDEHYLQEHALEDCRPPEIENHEPKDHARAHSAKPAKGEEREKQNRRLQFKHPIDQPIADKQDHDRDEIVVKYRE